MIIIMTASDEEWGKLPAPYAGHILITMSGGVRKLFFTRNRKLGNKLEMGKIKLLYEVGNCNKHQNCIKCKPAIR